MPSETAVDSPLMRAKGQGTVTLRADGRYQIAVSRPNGKRTFLYLPRGTTEAQAEAKRVALLRAADVALTPDSPLSSFLRRWLVEVNGTVRATTYRHYAMICNQHLIPQLGKVKLSALVQSPDLLSAYLREGAVSVRKGKMLGRALSPQTVHHHLVVLRRALKLAEKWRLIDWNPARHVDSPKVEAFEGTALTVTQIGAFLKATADDPFYPIWQLALTSGMREGELLGLSWAAVDLDAGTLKVRRQLTRVKGGFGFVPPKTDRSKRTVWLPAMTVAALRAQQARQKELRMLLGAGKAKADSLVFTTSKGRPIHANVLLKELRRSLERAGLPSVRFHDLRDSAATWAIASGASLEDIKRMLGHSSIRLTSDTYGHLVEQRQREVVDRMEAMLPASQKAI